MKTRLDIKIKNDYQLSRSQAENLIRLQKVKVNDHIIVKTGYFVDDKDQIEIINDESFVSRAGLKLASVASELKLNFKDKIILDVGSSTGGFSDFALSRGAKKIYAVDVGTNQMDGRLRLDERIELHEKTDIRDFYLTENLPDIILIDVSFISVRLILPHIFKNLSKKCVQIVLMLKPQFEAKIQHLNKGVVKNNTYRRQILKDFENYLPRNIKIVAKKDSEIAGKKGNIERFYLLTKR